MDASLLVAAESATDILAVPTDGSASGLWMGAALGIFLGVIAVFVTWYMIIDRRRDAQRRRREASVGSAELNQDHTQGDQRDADRHHD
ncbi:hypothetical protein [Microbacterium sp. Leaf320]|uniref:hypothetical protein n=1 Tax=Microbacterium sp. Leaf320 TaxID=1736334 RepID=UPI0012FA4D98|nr:hypothetical protein [Microbacterium sp. Leaf320]